MTKRLELITRRPFFFFFLPVRRKIVDISSFGACNKRQNKSGQLYFVFSIFHLSSPALALQLSYFYLA